MTEELENFDSFPAPIRESVADMGWQEPMPVQRRVIPVMRRNTDLIVQAVTGSGKTGAFGLPIVERFDPNVSGTQALVLAPTRELANQISAEINLMGKKLGMESMAVYGGTAYGPQLDAFRRGVHVVVGTPGRLLDHLNSGSLKLDGLKVLIFDEADELLSLGFWPDMREIQRFLPKNRQTGLFSATMPERVRSLSRVFLNDPEFISLTEGGVRTPDEIEHCHYIVSAQDKEAILLRILEYENPDSAIIFCNTRDDTRYLTAYLQRNHLDADMIQGEMSQVAREKVMRRTKAADLRYLVATDVAARGIDISDLSHVISYTSPDSPEVYLHRTGRTGRAGKTGTAISLVSGLDIGAFRNMQAVNQMVVAERTIPTPDEVADRVAQRLENELEHDLRHLSERERKTREEDLLPIVERLALTESARRHLSALLFAHLRDRPKRMTASEEAEAEEAAAAAARASDEAPEAGRENRPLDHDDDRGSDGDSGDRPRKKRRRRRKAPRSQSA